MGERRARNSELRLRRLERQESVPEEERGILELFDDPEQRAPDEDAPLARQEDDGSE